ncbi:MAG: hypothetical protein EBT03_09860 [Betaproteobacteria bacterium]|nr:hypothetical protein [Betaproteobacteria bacterium]
MAQFDMKAWRDRSWRRFERSIQREGDARKAETTWFEDQVAISDMQLVIEWCTEKKVDVVFTRRPNGIINFTDRQISITSNARPVKQLVYLLHECGHLLIGTGEEDDRFRFGYPVQWKEVQMSSKAFAHKLACVEEEFEAWHRGWRLSRRLGLDLKRQQFDLVRRECLKSYLKWGTGK